MNKTVSIKSLIFWAAIVLAILFFWSSCKGGFRNLFGSRTDTVSVKSDTVWMVAAGDTVYKPMPYAVTNTIYKPIYHTDTLEITEILPTDTARILQRFYEMAFYSDTVSKNDTTLRKYGKLIVNDSISQNRIVKRRVITDFKIPEVTNTITLNQKKNVVYLGAGVMGTIDAPLFAVGGDVSLKNKNDRIYSVGAYTTKDGKIYYKAEYKIPIRLFHKK